MDEDIQEFLEHHGVKGQKWGVRNEAKPTGRATGKKEDERSVLQKIGDSNLRKNTERQKMLKARAAKADIRLSEIMAEQSALPKTAVAKRYSLNQEKTNTKAQMDRDLKKARNPPTRGLTSTQKKLLIGVGVAGVLIGGSYVAKHYDVEGFKAAVRRGQSYREHGSIFKKNESFADKNLSPDQVLNNVVKGINPNYGSQGGHMNCRRATFAYELRRRGHDVVATTSSVGYGQGETGLINALVKGDRNRISARSLSSQASFDPYQLRNLRTPSPGDTRILNADRNSVGQLSDLVGVLSGKPNGSRGEAVFNQGAFAHSLQWEIFDGVPHLFDAQKGQHFPGTAQGLRDIEAKWGKNFGVEVTRLDNVDLDLAFLSRWATNTP